MVTAAMKLKDAYSLEGKPSDPKRGTNALHTNEIMFPKTLKKK